MFKKKTSTGILSLLLLTAGLLSGKAGYAAGGFPGPLPAAFSDPDIIANNLNIQYTVGGGATNTLTITGTPPNGGNFRGVVNCPAPNGCNITNVTYTLSAVLDNNNNNQLISGTLTITGGISDLGIPDGTTLVQSSLAAFGTSWAYNLISCQSVFNGTFQFLANIIQANPALGFGPTLVVNYANSTLSPDFCPNEDFGSLQGSNADNSTPADYGDAPDTGAGTGPGNYNTLHTDNGPRHLIGYPVYLGSIAPDGDTGTLQNVSATADNLTGINDEDGIPVLPIIPPNSSAPVSMTVNATNDTNNAALLACWIDFNRNGVFESTELATTTVPANSGTNPYSLTFSGFGTTGTGTTYIRCRISTDPAWTANPIPTGGANNGEVEDYGVSVPGADYGDAPDTSPGTGPGNYNTVDTDNGPYHLIVTNPQVYLGSVTPDLDSGTLQNTDATADDITGAIDPNTQGIIDDEDGLVALPSILTTSTSVGVKISAANLSGSPATLACWIDFNRDGDFNDTGERATVNVPAGTAVGTQFNLTFTGFITPPAQLSAGDTYLRCRISTDPAWKANPIPTGGANNGEVEDFEVPILPPCTAPTITRLPVGSSPVTGYIFSLVQALGSAPIASIQCTSATNLNLDDTQPTPPPISFNPTPTGGFDKFTEWGPTWYWNPTGPTSVTMQVNKINLSQSAFINCNVTDANGQTCSLDPVFTTVTKLPKAEKGDNPNLDVAGNRLLTGVWTQDDYLTVKNGDPGIKQLEVIVNGTKLKVKTLAPNEEQSLCIKSAMLPGDNNTIELKVKGKPGGQADVEIKPADGRCGQ
ncbi:MAG: GEVED domain-containing protein [Candidatus Competibacteraceae bacterium]